MSIKDITVVITSFKSDEKLKNCLNSIDRQCKVIIVENSNNLEFKKNLEQKFNNVECILTGENLGYGKGNNIGLKRVRTKYALILNPDAILAELTLENFTKAAELIPDFAIMAPHKQDIKIEIRENVEENFYPQLVKNVKGFAMFLKLSEFKEIGFFDENFFLYFEDIDLCRQLVNHNKKIYLISNIKINHLGAQSSDKLINKERELTRNWHWMWSTFYYHKKYKGFFISFLIILPKLTSSMIKILIYSMLMNREKKEIYYQRFSGLINAIMGKSSWYRPKL